MTLQRWTIFVFKISSVRINSAENPPTYRRITATADHSGKSGPVMVVVGSKASWATLRFRKMLSNIYRNREWARQMFIVLYSCKILNKPKICFDSCSVTAATPVIFNSFSPMFSETVLVKITSEASAVRCNAERSHYGAISLRHLLFPAIITILPPSLRDEKVPVNLGQHAGCIPNQPWH